MEERAFSVMDAFDCPFIHRRLLVHMLLYCSFMAERRFVVNYCNYCVLVSGDVNMFQITPTSTNTSTS